MVSVNRRYYQSHECQGFRAKVTIEWDVPDGMDLEFLPAWRMAGAEDIADSIVGFAGKKMRDMVQSMRGFRPKQQSASPTGALMNGDGVAEARGEK